MKRLFSLVRVVSKQGFDDILNMTNVQSKKKSNKSRLLQLVVAIALLIYFGVLIFFPAYYITEGFLKLGQPSLIISRYYLHQVYSILRMIQKIY